MKLMCRIFGHKARLGISGSVMTNWTIFECTRCGIRLGEYDEPEMEKYREKFRKKHKR